MQTNNLVHFHEDEIDRVNKELKETLTANIDLQERLRKSEEVCIDIQEAMKASQTDYEAKIEELEKEKEYCVY